jgi:photosystem II stability/assembly factor-like uncharacterized protein
MDGRRAFVAVCGVVLGLCLVASSLAAQEPEPQPGEVVLASGPDLTLTRVIAPASGALFVVGQDAGQMLRLQRSDDGGAIWRSVSLPPAASGSSQVVAVDPSDHTTIYATGADGLYKTDDDAASWRALLPVAEPHVTIAVSPADRSLVYLALRAEKTVRILRSQDGGESWETAYTHESAETACDDPILVVPHPTDPDRVFANVDCDWRVAGDLYQSRDRGATWAVMLAQGSGSIRGHPSAVVGGSGARPERLYASFAQHWVKGPGFHLDAVIYVSDDDGQTWKARVVAPLEVSGPKSQERNPVVVESLAADPSVPDRVYIGLRNARARSTGPLANGPLQVSSEGGATWKVLDVGEARHAPSVALGVDRQNLYAVTDQGLYRLRLR